MTCKGTLYHLHLGEKSLRAILASLSFLSAGLSPSVSAVPECNPALDTRAVLPPFRVGFSMNIFTDVNVNDAKASIKVWAQTVAREQGISTDADTALYRSFGEISHALETKSVDLVACTAIEYWKLCTTVDFDPLFISIQHDHQVSEYLILSHRNSGVRSLADLRGRNLLIFVNPRLELGEIWLDTLLLRNGFPIAGEFAGRVSRLPRLSGVVLPVFFKKAEACLVDRLGFELLTELNPQIGKDLVAIETSPPFVSAMVAMRRDCPPELKAKLVSALRDIHLSVAGQQLMTVFQIDRLQQTSSEALDPACNLLNEHRQLLDTRIATPSPADEKEAIR